MGANEGVWRVGHRDEGNRSNEVVEEAACKATEHN